jgi:multiple sugar transport system ATP-binding protein
MSVEVVEVLGSDQYLYGKVGGDEVIARLEPPFKVAVRDKVRLHVNMRRLHLFDVETERAVL